jgi:Domain of unknown function (DUF4360)
MKKTLLTLAISLLSAQTLRAENFQIQNIRLGGLGCPSETTQVVISTDNQTASILFNNFEARVPIVQTGPKPPGTTSILNCNIFVDIKLPLNVKLDSVTINADMRGYTSMEKGVAGSFKSYLVSKTGLGTETNSRPGTPELILNKEWGGKNITVDEDFNILVSKKIPAASQCSRGGSGDIVTVRLQNTLTTQILAGFKATSEGNITMDSSDVSGGFKISAQASNCRNGGRIAERNCRNERIGNKIVEVCR